MGSCHLGNSHSGNCHLGSRPWEYAFGKIPKMPIQSIIPSNTIPNVDWLIYGQKLTIVVVLNKYVVKNKLLKKSILHVIIYSISYFIVYNNSSLILIIDIYIFNTPNAVNISKVLYTNQKNLPKFTKTHKVYFLFQNALLSPIPCGMRDGIIWTMKRRIKNQKSILNLLTHFYFYFISNRLFFNDNLFR